MEIQQKHASIIPHVLIFPLPIQSPVNSMLKLAELLILATNDIHVTFLTTEHVYNRLILGGANATARFHQNPRFSIETFSDGLPKDHIRGGEKFLEMLESTVSVSRGFFKKMLAKLNVTCVIAEGLFDFVVDVGRDARVPVIYFDTICPSSLWVNMCLPQLIDAGQVPIRENDDLDALVDVVPSMETFLRRRDLPDFCRGRNETDDLLLQGPLEQHKQFQKAQGIILNTFDDLEPHLLSFMRSYFLTEVYTIGPLHFHLEKKMQIKESLMEKTSLESSICSNSFWVEDNSCMAWLNERKPRSVVFCSFGSQVVVTKEQLIEFWYGLVNSGCYFLWVKRSGSVGGIDDDFEKLCKGMDTGLVDKVSRKGFIVSWAPQEKVLSHPAVGGFLTHSRWNSTLESIVAGVPMICWPLYVDQLVISRVVSEVWKVGLDMKDTCDRVIIEKMVKDVMHLRKQEFLDNATKLAILAGQSVDESGSSGRSLKCLIESIRLSFKL